VRSRQELDDTTHAPSLSPNAPRSLRTSLRTCRCAAAPRTRTAGAPLARTCSHPSVSSTSDDAAARAAAPRPSPLHLRVRRVASRVRALEVSVRARARAWRRAPPISDTCFFVWRAAPRARSSTAAAALLVCVCAAFLLRPCAAAPPLAPAGNAGACANATRCPCGARPPVWTLLSDDTSPASAAPDAPPPPPPLTGWCPLGCADARGDLFAPDASGEMMVDVDGACAEAAFEAWRAPLPSADVLSGGVGCPLTAFPLISLRHFRPCVNSTALAEGAAAVCTPCALPRSAAAPPPAPPPDAPPAPPPGAPPGSVEVVTATLCLVRAARHASAHMRLFGG
jgi:hypothetical protein